MSVSSPACLGRPPAQASLRPRVPRTTRSRARTGPTSTTTPRLRRRASRPLLAETAPLDPSAVQVYVVAIAPAVVCLPGVLVPFDLGLQPYGGITPVLTATIAMIAGGIGSFGVTGGRLGSGTPARVA